MLKAEADVACKTLRTKIDAARSNITRLRDEASLVIDDMNKLDLRVMTALRETAALTSRDLTYHPSKSTNNEVDQYLENVIDKLITLGRSMRLVMYYINPTIFTAVSPAMSTAPFTNTSVAAASAVSGQGGQTRESTFITGSESREEISQISVNRVTSVNTKKKNNEIDFYLHAVRKCASDGSLLTKQKAPRMKMT